MLELFGRLESVMKLLVIILGRATLGFFSQFTDAFLVFGNCFVEPFKASLDPDHLVIPGHQFG